MKKLLVIPLALALSGCATFQTLTGGIVNPITPTNLAAAESAYGAALAVAVNYKDLCAKRWIPPSCRPIVFQLQRADRKVQAALRTARVAAKSGRVDMSSIVAIVESAVVEFQQLAAANGVR